MQIFATQNDEPTTEPDSVCSATKPECVPLNYNMYEEAVKQQVAGRVFTHWQILVPLAARLNLFE